MDSDAVDVPDDHPWSETNPIDRMAFWCEDCEITVPVTAADPQAGIQLYCPECNEEMEGYWFYEDAGW